MKNIILTNSGEIMNRKSVLYRNAKTVLNCKNKAFKEKLLCDGATLNGGDACPASCSYCYVESQLKKLLKVPLDGLEHQSVIIRRSNAIDLLRTQLLNKHGRPRFTDPDDKRVVYSSTLVDCAGNLTLAYETAQMAKLIFENTNWQLRLLSKFNFLPQVVGWIPESYHHRAIFGVSTGTLDDSVASAIEQGAASVSKRIESLHWLQDQGLRTFAMICPSLPQTDYPSFARDMANALRIDKCEHVWAEVINVRGKSFSRTIDALLAAGLPTEAAQLKRVSGPGTKSAWEEYSRATFEAHAAVVPASKLRFLQYVTSKSAVWWADMAPRGAVPLGMHAANPQSVTSIAAPTVSAKSRASLKAWTTMRTRYSVDIIAKRQSLAAVKAWATRRANRTEGNL